MRSRHRMLLTIGAALAPALATRVNPPRTAALCAVGGPVLCCSGWPRSNGCAYLPVVAEGVGDAAEPPAVFVAGWRGHGGAGGAGGADDVVRVAGDQQGAAGAAADRRRVEPALPRVGVRHPEVRAADS